MLEHYRCYDAAYKRTGNKRPSTTITADVISSYQRPWLAGIQKDAPILDVGCGYGLQLYILQALGYTCLHGVEGAPGSFTVAREELHPSVDLELADAFEYLPRRRNRFDLITLNDVLEHIPRDRTVELLSLTLGALKEGGTIVVRVPNMSSLLAQHSMYLDFTHLVGFTEFSLMQVLDMVGFVGHKIVRPLRMCNWSKWRPWRPFHGLGLKTIANDFLHRFLYALRQQTPMPTVFDCNLEIYSTKPCTTES